MPLKWFKVGVHIYAWENFPIVTECVCNSSICLPKMHCIPFYKLWLQMWVSRDGDLWTMVLDYSRLKCFSVQRLFFPKMAIRWAATSPTELTSHIINPQRACAAKVTVVGLSVCLSVCLSTRILALQATRRPISDTSGFRTMRAWNVKWRFSWNDCVREICLENKRKSQYA